MTNSKLKALDLEWSVTSHFGNQMQFKIVLYFHPSYDGDCLGLTCASKDVCGFMMNCLTEMIQLMQ